MKVTGTTYGDLGIKRFYLEGVTVTDPCPHCGEEQEMMEEYLSYPKMNKKIQLDFYCPECDCDWKAPAILEVRLKPFGG